MTANKMLALCEVMLPCPKLYIMYIIVRPFENSGLCSSDCKPRSFAFKARRLFRMTGNVLILFSDCYSHCPNKKVWHFQNGVHKVCLQIFFFGLIWFLELDALL